jgi:hypothetical protein
MKINNIILETNKIRLRELVSEDEQALYEIVRDFSADITHRLFIKYCNEDNHTIGLMQENGMTDMLDFFKNKVPHNVQKDFFTELPDEKLYCPYGSYYAPFRKSIKDYLQKNQWQKEAEPRTTFRFAIEYQESVVGCFVFFIPKDDNGIEKKAEFRTISDFSVMTGGTHQKQWHSALYPFFYFVDKVIRVRNITVNDLYISVTVHPCNENSKYIFKNFKYVNDEPSSYHGGGIRKFYIRNYENYVNEILMSDKYINNVTQFKILLNF